MGRMRLFTRRLKRQNNIGGAEGIKYGNFGEISVVTGAIATLTGTTATYTSVIGTTVSGATHAGALFRANTQLILPTTAYTGAGMVEGSIYTTGTHIYVGRGGAWLSGSIG